MNQTNQQSLTLYPWEDWLDEYKNNKSACSAGFIVTLLPLFKKCKVKIFILDKYDESLTKKAWKVKYTKEIQELHYLKISIKSNSFVNVLKNIITFGGSGRVDNAQKHYEETYKEYRRLVVSYDEKRKKFAEIAIKHFLLQKKAQKLANKINVFISTKEKERDFINTQIGLDVKDFDLVQTSLKNGQLALNTIKSAVSGAVVANAVPSAMLTVASMIGTAGTGTAISTLSGAAATNAALAWLGGGPLAVGGGGMAAGSALISTAVPVVGAVIALVGMVAFSHLDANKKIKAIEEEEYKLAQESEKCEKEILKVNYCATRLMELRKSLKKSEKAFKHMFKKTYIKVYPLGIFSRIKKRRNFSENDMKQINNLLGTARAMLQIRDIDVEKDWQDENAKNN